MKAEASATAAVPTSSSRLLVAMTNGCRLFLAESPGVTPQAATALAAALAGHRYHFTRKEDGLRLRTREDADGVLGRLAAGGLIAGWHERIYEPETWAFGGTDGMAIAHDVFCADSPAALAGTGAQGPRERVILLISAMTRAAGLDPFETGDVWARLAALRPPVDPPPPNRRAGAITAMRRLLTADAALWHGAESGWAGRVTAFEDAGRQLARLAVQHGGCTAGRSASGRGLGPLRADERECGGVNGLVGGVKKSGRCRHPGPVVRSVELGEVAGEAQQRNGAPESLVPLR
jgi:thiopeptide-type bacteriocin biosynthesis protein